MVGLKISDIVWELYCQSMFKAHTGKDRGLEWRGKLNVIQPAAVNKNVKVWLWKRFAVLYPFVFWLNPITNISSRQKLCQPAKKKIYIYTVCVWSWSLVYNSVKNHEVRAILHSILFHYRQNMFLCKVHMRLKCSYVEVHLSTVG